MKYKIPLALAVLMAALNVYADDSATLTLSGRILPGTCSLKLGDGGNVYFGDRPKSQIRNLGTLPGSAFPHYVDAEKKIQLDIACDVPVELSIGVSDNRASGAQHGTSPQNSVYEFGLSRYLGTDFVGFYEIRFSELQVSRSAGLGLEVPAGYLYKATGSAGAWNNAAGKDATHFGANRSIAFNTSTLDNIPDTVISVSGLIGVRPYFRVSTVDAASAAINIDGSATFTINYH